jgi:rare lipoprotein A (peptidoglycan hydrolase)
MHPLDRVIRVLVITIAVLLAVVASASAEPTPIPFASTSSSFAALGSQIDEATANALQMERAIEEMRASGLAISERIKVTEERMRDQDIQVERAEIALQEATQAFGTHLVATYKRGSVDPISLLLGSETLSDLISRVSVLTRLAEDDARIVADRNIAAADARYQASVLDDLRAQDTELRRQQDERIRELEGARADQEAVVASLTAEAQEVLKTARKLDGETRARWRASSLPIGVPIPRADATVIPYTGIAYRISAYMPRTYRTADERFSAVCSWYGNEFNGRGAASGQLFNEEDFTCASRTLPFGTILALTRGDRRVIVYVNDRGPFVTGRDLDLSKAAARELGVSGVAAVQAEIIIAE